jgi:hypothetical protein
LKIPGKNLAWGALAALTLGFVITAGVQMTSAIAVTTIPCEQAKGRAKGACYSYCARCANGHNDKNSDFCNRALQEFRDAVGQGFVFPQCPAR